MSGLYASGAAIKVAGISYRQLDYWVTQGYVDPATFSDVARGGTGNYRVFDEDAMRRLRDMGAMASVGMRPADASALIDAIDSTDRVHIGPFVIERAPADERNDR